MNILTLNTNPLALEGLGSLNLYFEIATDCTLTFTQLDIDNIVIKTFLKYQGKASELIHDELQKGITAVQNEGYVFLNLQVLTALLQNPSVIPSAWEAKADTDSISGTSIEFRGTVLKHKDKGTLYIPTLSFSRGVWEIGTRLMDEFEEDLSLIGENTLYVHRQAAVYLKN